MKKKVLISVFIIFGIIFILFATAIIYFTKNKDMIRLEIYLELNGYEVTDTTASYKNINIEVVKNITTEDGNIMSNIFLFKDNESAKNSFEKWANEQFEKMWWIEDKSTLYENCYSVSESGVEKYNIGGKPILLLNGKYVFYGDYKDDYNGLIDLCEKLNDLE